MLIVVVGLKGCRKEDRPHHIRLELFETFCEQTDRHEIKNHLFACGNKRAKTINLKKNNTRLEESLKHRVPQLWDQNLWNH